MKYSLIIQCPPSSPTIATSALKFARALLSSGHSIERIFFYGDGVYLGNMNTAQPQDEYDLQSNWKNFIESHNLDSVICIATALKRGIIDEQEAQRYSLTPVTGAPFELSGLGQLVDCCASSDRVITFA